MSRSKWTNRCSSHPSVTVRAAYHTGMAATMRDVAMQNARLETRDRDVRRQWVGFARTHSKSLVWWMQHLRNCDAP